MTTHRWQKSSYCGEGEACIHVAADGPTILLTESADPTGAILRLPRPDFTTLLTSIKSGTHPLNTTPDGTIHLGPVTTTLPKWQAFTQGIHSGEFDHFTAP
ncbi:DUF397 domain-containing protein [Streptomyces sp. KLOTTS4A1]|uniref:DUF397 domain-containing protein n=1 Tax=Streptomyces sp. KLOTTS4A1 TaxID=3390996 RepID=UPI0039F48495